MRRLGKDPVRAIGAGALLAAIAALHVAGYASTTTIVDTARDVGEAWRIANEGAWPLRGPQIGQRWSLGPAWFYLLAPIVALARSMTAVALAVGVLATLKLALAFELGRRFCGARFGLLSAFVLALPGWASLEHVVFAHTNLAGTATLAFGLAVHAAWRRPDALRHGLAGLALALAMHAHPSAIVLAPAAVAAAFARPRAAAGVALRSVALALGFVVPFVPMLVAEAREGWPMLARSGEYLAAADPGARLARMPAVVLGGLFAPVVLVRDFLLGEHAALRAAWVAGTAALAALGLVGLVRASARRHWMPAWLFGGAVAATGSLALLREAVAFYFVLPLLPLVAAAAAASVHAASERHRDLVIALVGAFALAANVVVLRQRAEQASLGEQWLPRASLADVARWPVADPVPVDYLPVIEADRTWVPLLCGAARPAALHGDIAAQLELAQALPLVLACPAQAARTVLGGPAQPGVAGLPVGLMLRANVPVATDAYGHVRLTDVEAVHPARGRPLGLHATYPPHPFEAALDERVVLTARSGRAAHLAVTELDPAFVATGEPRVFANRAPIAPIARSAATRLYACTACAQPVEWRIELASGSLEWVDVFLFRATGPTD